MLCPPFCTRCKTDPKEHNCHIPTKIDSDELQDARYYAIDARTAAKVELVWGKHVTAKEALGMKLCLHATRLLEKVALPEELEARLERDERAGERSGPRGRAGPGHRATGGHRRTAGAACRRLPMPGPSAPGARAYGRHDEEEVQEVQARRGEMGVLAVRALGAQEAAPPGDACSRSADRSGDLSGPGECFCASPGCASCRAQGHAISAHSMQTDDHCYRMYPHPL